MEKQQTDLWWRFTAIKKIWRVRSSDKWQLIVAEVVAHLGKDGFVKHFADKLRDSGEMSLIL